jgi:hypothetical protein
MCFYKGCSQFPIASANSSLTLYASLETQIPLGVEGIRDKISLFSSQCSPIPKDI